MNWRVAFFIWLKGVGIFGICCTPFLGLGLWAFSIGLMISWVAIPVYAISLWIIKACHIPHTLSMILMLLIPTASSVLAALYFLHFVDTEMVSGGESLLFWVPLFCCILSVILSAKSIYCFLHPEAVPEEFIIE